MKKTLLFTICFVSILVFSSCEKETILTVNQASLSINNSGGSQTVNIVANKVWSASSNQSWCKVSPSSGDGSDNSNFTLSVSCDANTTYDARTCTITITCEELTKTISVSQAEGKGLIISQTEYNLTNDAQTISVEVQANVQYTVEIDNACKSWIKQESTKALSSNTIKFAISKNEDYDGREGKIIIKQTDGSLSGTVVVKQSQQNGLFVSTPEYSLSNEKHTLTIEVKANVEFDVKPNVDWIKHVETKGLKTSQIVLEVAANEDYDEREGVVVVKQKNGDLEGVITIHQEQGYCIDLSKSSYSISNEEQTIDIEIKYNVDFDVVIPDTCKKWISVISTKGLSSRVYTILIAKNESYDYREGSITFKQNNGSLSGTVYIYQSQTDGLIAEKKEYIVSAEEQEIRIRVAANIPFQIIIDSSCDYWLSHVQTKGLQDYLYLFQVAKNEGEERVGKIIFNGENIQETVIIRQEIKRVVEFEDANFKAYCVEHFDENHDGEISSAEALKIDYINVSTNDITSMKGIEYMPNLIRLRCSGEDNPGALTSLNISNNTLLRYLLCSNNKIESLDLRNNTALINLDCNNNKLTSLDLRKNTALQYVNCFNNYLTTLSIGKDSAIESLSCHDNQLASLDISNQMALYSLNCSNNLLTTLNVSNNSELNSIQCKNNQLTSLDVNTNTKLDYLDCGNNRLTNLDISKNTSLTQLMCNNNLLSSIDVSSNVMLRTIWCNDNSLTSLTLSNTVALGYLQCYSNQLTTLDVSNNTKLQYLNCNWNPYLTEIWLKTGQFIPEFYYDTYVATIKYKN